MAAEVNVIKTFERDAFVSTAHGNAKISVSDVSVKPYIYINGKSIANIPQNGILPNATYRTFDDIYHIHIESDKACTISITDVESSTTQTKNVTFSGQSEDNIRRYVNYKQSTKMLSDDVSYCLLRTNPKLTGNIKVVVDSDSNLYLDTFKVSNALSQSKYRRIKINPDEYYGRSVMSKFKDMPSDDLYKVEESCYKIFSTANTLGEQYYDKYNYGVRTNSDRMYSENFSLLAPLCIKKTVPDFFIIFKVKDYDGIADRSRLKSFLEKGEIVKIYDMRQGTPIGKYVRNIHQHTKDFVGDIYVSYDYDKNNLFNGISLDRGVVTSIYESASLERNIKNQVAMNDWYTLGFERNRLLSKDIINFEFMFNDTEEKLFSLNTYFGLYVKLNGEDENFTCIGITSGNVPIFDTSVSGTGFDAAHYPEAIYGLTTPDGFTRIQDGNVSLSTNVDLLRKYSLTPYENIISPEIVQYPEEYMNRCYASVKLYDALEPGEHYRIVDKKNKKIFDVIISDVINNNFDISEVNYRKDASTDYDIQSISIYNCKHRIDINDSSVDSIIDDQVVLLQSAFNKFDTDKILSYYGDKSFSIIYDETFTYDSPDYVLIEKVSYYHAISDDEKSVLESMEDHSSVILGENDIESIIVDCSTNDTFEKVLYPNGFEILGQRKVYCSLFIPLSNNGVYKAYQIKTDVTEPLKKLKTIMYRTVDGYSLFYGFNVYSLKSDGAFKVRTIKDVPGFGNEESYIIELKDDPLIINGNMFFYSNIPLNAGICSIFNIKDFDFDILDNANTIWKDGKTIPGSTAGRFSTQGSITESYIRTGTEERITSYLDKYERYSKYTINGTSIDFTKTILDSNTEGLYLSTMSNNNHKSSDISLISPYCCKWKHDGTDYTGLPLRVMFNLSTSLDNSSYFLVCDSSGYIGGLADTSTRYTEKNVGHYINDYGVSRDLFYGKGNIDSLISDKAMSYMASVESFGKNEISFIYGGLKIKISSKNANVIDLSKYNNYKAIIICCKGNNPKITKGADLLIDEINERIIITYYSGSSKISYNKYNHNYFVSYDMGGQHDTFIIDPCYRIPRYSHLTDCFITYVNLEQRLFVPDDASYYDNVKLFGYDPYHAYIFLTSSISDASAYTLEKYNLVVGEFNPRGTIEEQGLMYNEMYPDYFYVKDGSIYSNSIQKAFDNFSIENELKKKNEAVDGFIIWKGSSGHYQDDAIDSSYAANLTPEFEKFKELLESPSIYVKTQSGNLNYTNVENLIKIEVLDPISFNRENSDFKKTSDVGNVYTGSASPVTKDVIVFDQTGHEIDDIGEDFNKNFENSNIIISSHNNLSQLWLRKYSVDKLNGVGEDSSGGQEYQYYRKSITLDSYSGVPYNIIPGMSIKQEHDSSIYEFVIDETVNFNEHAGCLFDMVTQGQGFVKLIVTDASLDAEIKNDEHIDFYNKNIEIVIYHEGHQSSYTSKLYGQILKSEDFDDHVDKTSRDTCLIYGKLYTTIDIFSEQDPVSDIRIVDEITGTELARLDEDISYIGIGGDGDWVFYSSTYYSTDSSNNGDQGYIYIKSKNLDSSVFEGPWYDVRRITPGTPSGYAVESALVSYNDASVFYVRSYNDVKPDGWKSDYWESGGAIEYTAGIDAISNISPLSNCWESPLFRTYHNFDEYDSESGAESGYELNTFFASRGLNLYGKDGQSVTRTIVIDKWINTVINQANNKITLDVTDSLINKILFMEGYSENWENKNIVDVQNKSKYIQNSVLKYIRIDNKCKVTVYKVKESNVLSVIDIDSYDNLYEVKNVSNTLYRDGENYYMDLDKLDNSGYAIKFEIKL